MAFSFIIFTTSFNIQKFYVLPTQFIYVFLCLSEKKRLFLYTTLTDWFL